MERILLKNKKIRDLEEKVKGGNNRAIEEFLHELENSGTPLIEELEDDPEKDLVTFVYKADKDYDNKDRMIDTNKNLRNTLLSKGYDVDFEEFKSSHDYLC